VDILPVDILLVGLFSCGHFASGSFFSWTFCQWAFFLLDILPFWDFCSWDILPLGSFSLEHFPLKEQYLPKFKVRRNLFTIGSFLIVLAKDQAKVVKKINPKFLTLGLLF